MLNTCYAILKSNQYGIGVYATKSFKVGEYIKLYNKDNVLVDVHLTNIPEEYKKFVVYRENNKCNCPKDFSQVETAWYLNHSDLNNLEENWDLGLYKVVRNINKGDELTIDYNIFEEPEDKKEDFYKKS
jgi:hypothetical protein